MDGNALDRAILDGHDASSAITMAFDQLRSCIFLLDRKRGIRFQNLAARQVLARRDGLLERTGRLHAKCQTSDQRLEAAFETLSSVEKAVLCEAVLIERSGAQPYRLLLTPLSGSQQTYAPIADVMAIAEDPESNLFGEDRLLKTLYGLSCAEARLALALAQGISLQDYAATRGISWNTARSHIKRVFAKTQTANQTQLAQLLLRGPLSQVNGRLGLPHSGAADDADGCHV